MSSGRDILKELEAENKRLAAERDRLREVLEDLRDAVASTPEETFGAVPDSEACIGYWIRDALVHNATKALESANDD
jgi:regulator of replication initiation timing